MSASENLIIHTQSPDETLALGATLGESLVGGMVIGLCGPLGAGKTQLVKGIAQGNAVADVRQVTSPTFTLLQEYSGRLTLFHLDAYRLPSPAALAALGFDELIRPDSAVLVEWADRALPVLPATRLMIQISPVGETERAFAFTTSGEREFEWVEGLHSHLKSKMIRSS